MAAFSQDFLSLLDAQEHPTVVIDSAYRIVAANRAYCEAYGVRADQVVGRTCHEVSHHSDAPCYLKGEDCPHQRVLQSRSAYEVLHTHYDAAGQAEHARIRGYPIDGAAGAHYVAETIIRLGGSQDGDCERLGMHGKSPAFLACLDKLSRAAESEAPILLIGESGVGKELAAQFIHRRSARRSHAYVALDCAAIPESLFESELFGYEPGAFTGSVGRKQGLFELADGGTMFFDEVGEMPLPVQAKLLRALETGQFRRIGGKRVLQADVRVVSATNRDLLGMVDRGAFRQDLYYRIAGIDIELPPLRARRADIPLLAEVILKTVRIDGRTRYRLTERALSKLMGYEFPGNVRELRNMLHKACAMSDKGIIDGEHIQTESASGRASGVRIPAVEAPAARGVRPHVSMLELEAGYIAELLDQYKGHRRTVADVMGISERTLYRKLRRYGLGEKGTN